MFYLGVDPGKTGAFALRSSVSSRVDYFKCPDSPQEIVETLKRYKITLAAIERVHAFPKAGVSGMFNFGANFGMWQGILAGMGIPYILVGPKVWQQKIIDSVKKHKNPKAGTLAFVNRRLNMQLKKSQHNEADAICLALYARSVDRND